MENTSSGSSSSSRLLRLALYCELLGLQRKQTRKKGGTSLLLSSLHSQSLRELAPAGTSQLSPRFLFFHCDMDYSG
ncbi:hypothetical protein R3I93_022642 [Phoxinus phoxinus]|uniref:Uncharacterized protein n=1 Tax=Phoxinus phoxinus TaxID=58324 RepID=A0AAN9C4L6_9TELE